jgi:hypothetical protein
MLYMLDNPLFTAEPAESMLPALVAMREAQMQDYAAAPETVPPPPTPSGKPAAAFAQPQISCQVTKFTRGLFERPLTQLDAHFASLGIQPRAGPERVQEDVLF